MDHTEMRHKLSDYVDDALPPEEKAALEEHLRECVDCDTALRELRETLQHVRNIEEVDPPAWMTQKIMSRVRAGESKKPGLLQRLFFPLHIKLPLEALGVLFIGITVFFLVQDRHLADQYSDAPVREFRNKESSSQALEPGPSAPAAPASPEKVPQKPEYKALDMQQAYDGPPPPRPSETPAESERRALSQPYSPEPSARLRKAAPGFMAEKNDQAAGAAKAKECLEYEPVVVTVAGLMVEKVFPGRPNYESIEAGDERETAWILRLDNPLCTVHTGDGGLKETESMITEIQLVLDARNYRTYEHLLAKRVSVRGKLFDSKNGLHRTPVFMSVENIELLR